jgi:hypothetical protein
MENKNRKWFLLGISIVVFFVGFRMGKLSAIIASVIIVLLFAVINLFDKLGIKELFFNSKTTNNNDNDSKNQVKEKSEILEVEVEVDDNNPKKRIKEKEKISENVLFFAKALISWGVIVSLVSIISFLCHYCSYAEKAEEPINPLALKFSNTVDTLFQTSTILSLDTTQLKTLQEVMKDNGDKNAIDYASSFGDFMAGTALGLWSLGGLLLVYVSFLGQQIGLLYTEKELEATKKGVEDTKKSIEDTKETVIKQTEALQGMMRTLQQLNMLTAAQTGVLSLQKDEMNKMVTALDIQNTKIENQTGVLQSTVRTLQQLNMLTTAQTNVLSLQKEAMNEMVTELNTQNEKIENQTGVLQGMMSSLQHQIIENKINYYVSMLDNFIFTYEDVNFHRYSFFNKKEHIDFAIQKIKINLWEDDFYGEFKKAVITNDSKALEAVLVELMENYTSLFSPYVMDYFNLIYGSLVYLILLNKPNNYLQTISNLVSRAELSYWFLMGLYNNTTKVGFHFTHSFKFFRWKNLAILFTNTDKGKDLYEFLCKEDKDTNKVTLLFKNLYKPSAFGEEAPPETPTTEKDV